MKEPIKIQTTLAYISYSSLATWQSRLSQKTVDSRKEGMFCGKIISSHLIGKAVNNYSQFWK